MQTVWNAAVTKRKHIKNTNNFGGLPVVYIRAQQWVVCLWTNTMLYEKAINKHAILLQSFVTGTTIRNENEAKKMSVKRKRSKDDSSTQRRDMYMLLEIVLVLFEFYSIARRKHTMLWLINCYQITFEINNVRCVRLHCLACHTCVHCALCECVPACLRFARFETCEKMSGEMALVSSVFHLVVPTKLFGSISCACVVLHGPKCQWKNRTGTSAIWLGVHSHCASLCSPLP